MTAGASRAGRRTVESLVRLVPLAFLGGVLATFGLLSSRFLEPENLVHILVQSAPTAIVATGMTFVLLTAGVDLSVGAILFVGAAVAAKMIRAGHSIEVSILAMLCVGILFGGVNGLFITRLRVLPFVVTLSTLYFGRGLALWITETRAMNLPPEFLNLGSLAILELPLSVLLAGLTAGSIALAGSARAGRARWGWLGCALGLGAVVLLGVPAWLGDSAVRVTPPLMALAVVVLAAHGVLTRTPFGRQVYAVGADPEAARKAGIRTRGVLWTVYGVSGFLAALGGLVSLTQLGAVSPTFGYQKEFAAIAAAVLGGTSLFGGRGSVLPGTLLGALLIQTVESGLVAVGANPYVYPMITSGVIFAAVLLDSSRQRLLARFTRRRIRLEEE